MTADERMEMLVSAVTSLAAAARITEARLFAAQTVAIGILKATAGSPEVEAEIAKSITDAAERGYAASLGMPDQTTCLKSATGIFQECCRPL